MSTNRFLQFLSKKFSQSQKTAPSEEVDRTSDEVANAKMESPPPTKVDQDAKVIAVNLKNQGNAYLEADMLALAINSYQQALKIYPEYAEAYVNLGSISMRESNYVEAKRLLLKAVSLNSSIWQAHFNLGIVYEETKDIENSISSYKTASELIQSNSECYWRLGNALNTQKRYAEALEAYNSCLSIAPDLLEIRFNRGIILLKLEKPNEALADFEIVLQSDESPKLHSLMAIAYADRYERQLAINHCQRAIELSPNYYQGHFELSLLLLEQGDYQNGFGHYEKRLQWKDEKPWLQHLDRMMNLSNAKEYWNNQPLTEKSILFWTEQGVGDMIMMLRYLPIIKKNAPNAKIYLFCDKSLTRIIQCLGIVDVIINERSELVNQEYDYHCSIMSLPYVFSTTLDNIPEAPYMEIKDYLANNLWASRLANYPGVKVGIAWAGNPDLGTDRKRSIPLETLMPLMSIKNITWINLQKNQRTNELNESGWPMVNWMDDCVDFYDSACLINNLDLVIAVDTSVVHVAGALGKPTWLLNRYGGDWRWKQDGETAPWYNSVKIFRQSEPGNWNSLIKNVSDQLEKLVRKY